MFGLKLKHMKSLGQKTDTFSMVNGWIRDNLDKLYEDESLRNQFCKPLTLA